MNKLSFRELMALVFFIATILGIIAGTALAVHYESWKVFIVMGVSLPAVFYYIFFRLLGIRPVKKIAERMRSKS